MILPKAIADNYVTRAVYFRITLAKFHDIWHIQTVLTGFVVFSVISL
jgi:hypothetical protein